MTRLQLTRACQASSQRQQRSRSFLDSLCPSSFHFKCHLPLRFAPLCQILFPLAVAVVFLFFFITVIFTQNFSCEFFA